MQTTLDDGSACYTSPVSVRQPPPHLGLRLYLELKGRLIGGEVSTEKQKRLDYNRTKPEELLVLCWGNGEDRRVESRQLLSLLEKISYLFHTFGFGCQLKTYGRKFVPGNGGG